MHNGHQPAREPSGVFLPMGGEFVVNRMVQLLIGVAAFLMVLPASPAQAQDGYAELSTAQRELNEAAVQAIIAEDYETGIQMLRSSLQLQPLNIIYLNLGRALSKVGRCDEALDAYANTLTAPKVRQPSPDQVAELLATYQLDLQETCDGTLVLRCSPLDAKLSFDGGKAVSCLEQPFKLPPGEHTVTATAEGAKADVSHTFSIRGTKTTELEATLEVEKKVTPPDGNGGVGVGPSPPQRSYALLIVGSIVTTLGVGSLATAGGLELVGSGKVDDFNTAESAGERERIQEEISELRVIATTMWVVGSVLTVTGATLLLIHFLEDDPDDTTNVGFWALPDSAGITFEMRF